jgi:hypothetical protein
MDSSEERSQSLENIWPSPSLYKNKLKQWIEHNGQQWRAVTEFGKYLALALNNKLLTLNGTWTAVKSGHRVWKISGPRPPWTIINSNSEWDTMDSSEERSQSLKNIWHLPSMNNNKLKQWMGHDGQKWEVVREVGKYLALALPEQE